MLDVDSDGDLVVLIKGELKILNPGAVTCVTDPETVPAESDSDDACEIPAGTTF